MQIDSSTASLDLLTCDLTNKDEAISINKVILMVIIVFIVFIVSIVAIAMLFIRSIDISINKVKVMKNQSLFTDEKQKFSCRSNAAPPLFSTLETLNFLIFRQL